MVETLSQLFLNTVKTYIKDSLLTSKAEGRVTYRFRLSRSPGG